jgi:hypothetical protein
MTERKILLTCMVPDNLKDDAIDFFLSSEGQTGFNMIPMMGFSKEHSQFDLVEQVQGYRSFVQFQVMLERCQWSMFKTELSAALSNSDIRYWLTYLDEEGHL